jgi:hypothetical protein
MDHAIDASATKQGRVRSVYNCVYILAGDVADDNLHSAGEKRLLRDITHCVIQS